MPKYFKRFLILLTLFAGLGMPVLAQEEDDSFWEETFLEEEALTRLEQAEEHFKNGKWDEAIAAYQTIIEDPLDRTEYENALWGLAASYEKKEKIDLAVRYYRSVSRQAKIPLLKEKADKKVLYYEEYIIEQFHIGEWYPKLWLYEMTERWAEKWPDYGWHFRHGFPAFLLLGYKFLLVLILSLLTVLFTSRKTSVPKPFSINWGLGSVLLIYSLFLILQLYLVYLLKPADGSGETAVFAFDVISILSYMILLAMVLLFLTFKGIPWKTLGFDVSQFGRHFVLAAKYMVVIVICFGVYTYLRSRGFIGQEKIIRAYPISSIGGAIHLFQFILLVIVAPISEEIFYRGFLYPVVRNKTGVIAGILLVSLFFALVHAQSLIVLFCLSFALCFLYEKNRSLLPPILVHAFYNFLVRFGGSFMAN